MEREEGEQQLEVPKVPKAVKGKVLMRRYRFAAQSLQGGSQSEKAQSSSELCTMIIVYC